MSYEAIDIGLVALQTHDFMASPAHLLEVEQSGPLRDRAMMAEASALPASETSVAVIMAALGEGLGVSFQFEQDLHALLVGFAEAPSNGEALVAGLDAMAVRSADLFLLEQADTEPFALDMDTPPTDELLPPPEEEPFGLEVPTVNSEQPIVVIGTRRYIVIVTDPAATCEPLPIGYDVLAPGEGGGDPPPLLIGLEGRECPVDQSAANRSLQSLYANSPTARALIDSMAASGVTLNLLVAEISGIGPKPQFEGGAISWDPFFVISGQNTDGSTYTLAPIMILAHELVHAGNAGNPAYQGTGSEPLVIPIANQIAREMNAATGSSYDTSRDSHGARDRFYTNSSTSKQLSIARPGCS